MDMAEGIRKVGFRRWYERQLVEGHLYLVTCLLSTIAALACAEGWAPDAAMPELLVRVAVIALGGWVSVWSLVRYLVMLAVAGRAAERSVCRRCSAYGLLEVTGVRGPVPPADTGVALTPVRVRCRQCGNEWTIE